MFLIQGNGIVCHYHFGFEALVDHVTLASDQAFVASHLNSLEALMDVVDLAVWSDGLATTSNLLFRDNLGTT